MENKMWLNHLWHRNAKLWLKLELCDNLISNCFLEYGSAMNLVNHFVENNYGSL